MTEPVKWLIFFLVVAVLLTVSTLIKKRFRLIEVAVIGVMAALAYVAYLFLRIPVSINGSSSSIHIGNMFPAVTAVLLDGPSGGLAGAIGLCLADIMNGQPHYAITTFILKYLIGIVCGAVAHGVFKIKTLTKRDGMRYVLATVASISSGLVLNIVTDPFLGYFRKLYIEGKPAAIADVLTKISGGASAINALICAVLGVAVYLALRPQLDRSGLLKNKTR